ncbi:MAG: ATP-binding protein [bacterium]|nr:ATP-binding protein [bacterium]
MKDVFSLAENLSTSILFTFGCLLFTIFLSIIYFSKEKQSDLRSKLYRIILSLVVFILSTEFIYLLCLGYSNSEFLITSVRFLHWLSFILWVCVYCIYCVVYMQKLQYNSFGELFRESKNSSFLLIVTCILLLGYAIAPKETIDLNLIKCIASRADYIVLVFLTCMCTYVLVCSYVLYKQYPLRRKIAITLIMFVMLVMLVLQVMFNDISVYVICCSLQVFFLYFIIENPDIHLAREIEGLKADIDKSNKSKTDFLSNMSHEIRTPMNAIIGFSDSLLNSPKFDENTARNDIQSIATAGTNLVDIINNILDISKIESGNDTLDNKECSIAKIVKELGSIIESRIGNNPVKLYIELDEQIPSKVYGDSTKIYQILLNITNNAVKYTEVGKIKLSIVPEKTGNDSVLLHIKISDTGYGIKKEDFDKIFEKFSRLDSAVSKEIEGTGLGLVITKKFVDLMGGKIWFTSEFEVGTTFYVDLPLKVIDPTPIGSVTQDTSVQRVRNFLDCSDFTALVVDDSRLNLKVAERLLKKYNFNVDVAQSGKDCIYKYKYGNHYDIIFLDHMMPEMDGIETARILRRLDDYETPPIIALTANAMNGMEEKYLSEGFDYYLPMPINTQELDKIIHIFFENKTVTIVDDNVKTHHENASAVPEVKVDKPIEKPSKVIEKIKHVDMENVKSHDNSEVKVAAPVTEEKPVEVKEKIKEETKVDEKPIEPVTDTKEEVKSEEKVEEKAEVTTEPEVKEETKVEEKPTEPATETKEETKTEAPVVVEEKTETTTEPEVKEETKVEEKTTETVPVTKEDVKAEEKVETPVVEEKSEVKEEAKAEEKVEEKPVESVTEPEVKTEEKTEPVVETKEEAKVEEKPEVKEEAKPESTEASNNDVSTDTVEVATDKSDDAMLAYLKEHGVNMDNSLELLGDMEMYNMTMGDFIVDVEAKWDRINQFKEASDMPNYAIEVHSLKSDCKYLGFMDLADISYQHELKSKENDVNFVNEHFDELVNEYNKVIKFVKTYIARYQLG